MKSGRRKIKYKIGIFGSNLRDKFISKGTIKKINELSDSLSNENVILVTGACSGIPYKVASNAAKKNVEVFGYSPANNFSGQKQFASQDDQSVYKKLFYIPNNFPLNSDSLVCKKYRNVVSIANCDAGIIISGRWGTMNEFTNLYDMEKVIGVLTGTGGIADELQRLLKKIIKKNKSVVIFDSSPDRLVRKIIKELNSRI